MIETFDDFTYGSPAVSKGLVYAMTLCQNGFFKVAGPIKILVVGAGNGYEIVYFKKVGHTVTGLDRYVPDVVKDVSVCGEAAKIPFEDKSFELVFCCEMLEHIPPETVNDILSEFKRVANQFFVSIATSEDPPYNTHINIRSGDWWLNKLEEYFTLLNFQYRPRFTTFFGKFVNSVHYDAGVHAYGVCRHLEVKTQPYPMESGVAGNS